MANAAAAPDLKVAENVHHDADSGTSGIKEDKV
jgi:hypothetical protein